MAPQWTTRTLNAGDIFHCDMYSAATEGYTWDFSRSVVAGGKWTADQNEVYDGTIEAIHAGVAACRPGVTLWKTVANVLDARKINCGYPLHGHSYGIGWESPWLVPGNETHITAGMAIAAECAAEKAYWIFLWLNQSCLFQKQKVPFGSSKDGNSVKKKGWILSTLSALLIYQYIFPEITFVSCSEIIVTER